MNNSHPLITEIFSPQRVIIKCGQIEIDIISSDDGITAEMRDTASNEGDVLQEMEYDWE